MRKYNLIATNTRSGGVPGARRLLARCTNLAGPPIYEAGKLAMLV
jgi:hypothetical protein